MRTVGGRVASPLSFSASAARLAEGARFNEEFQKLPVGRLTAIPKGLWRFRTHAEANRFDEECAAARMSSTAARVP